MAEKVTIELPEELIQQVQAVATHTQRSFDEVLAEWVRRAGSEPVLELLSDAELLAVCDGQSPRSLRGGPEQRPGRNQDLGTLDAVERRRLDDLKCGPTAAAWCAKPRR